MALFGRGRYNDACSAFTRAYKRSLKDLGQKSLNTEERRHHDMKLSIFLNNLGCAQYKSGKLKASHDSFTKAFEIQNLWLHQGTTTTVGNSSSLSPLALSAISKHKTQSVTNITTTLCNIGQVYIRRDENEKAIFVFEEALKVKEEYKQQLMIMLFIKIGSFA